MFKALKAAIYRSKFPEILSKRLIPQIDGVTVHESESHADLILDFAEWKETEEKEKFWYEIHGLYQSGIPSEEMIIEVFVKYEIEV